MPKILLCILLWTLTFWAQPAAAFTPNDPLFRFQAGLRLIGMEEAWGYQLGGRSDVTVAVVDTGVAYENYENYSQVSDLAQTRFATQSAFDFVEFDHHANDVNGHGTFVTGIIAQSTQNRIGPAGIAFRTTIMPIRAFNDQGLASAANVARGIDWAVDHGADIINLSAGGGNVSAVEQACRRAYEAGVLVVAAAGNGGGRGLDYPAAFEHTLAVGAVDYNLDLTSYTRYDREMLVAPGGDLTRDANGDGQEDGIVQQWVDGSFVYRQGTSFAAPHVSGVAALVLSEGLDLGVAPAKGPQRVDWLKEVLFSTAQDLGAAGQDNTYGYGLVRADQALASLNGQAPGDLVGVSTRFSLP